ncbi:Inversin, partial [Apaloderma vittatum]
QGRTALHWLCNNGYLDAIKLLLGFDAFPNHMENSEERYTPLDYALLGEHHEVIQFMLEHGALSIAAIQDIAAFKIQAVYKGYKVRKAFQERKNLLMKHEQLRKDAAAKKREEESKRKEAKLQKGMQNVEQNRFRAQQSPANLEKTTSVSQFPNKPVDTQNKRPLSLSASQIQPGRNSRGSPKACHNKGTPKESAEPQSESHKIRQDSLRKHGKGKSSCVHFHCDKVKEGTKVEMKRQVLAATEVGGEKHKEHTVEATRTCARRSRRHASACRTPSAGEKLRHPSQPSSGNRDHCEGAAVFFCNGTFTSGIVRNSKQCEASSKGKRHQQKSRNKEVNDERSSPAGSSRPGSAKMVFGNTRDGSVHAAEQTHKVGNNELAKRASSLLSAEAEPTRTAPRNPAACSAPDDSLNLGKTGVIGSRNADDQLCSVTWQSTNIELIPSEVRMQIIEKERKRKELFRKKNYAATVIQRTWRSYHLRQELFQLLGAKRQCKEDEDKWRQETAAFFIQVAWKKQLNHGPLKSVSSCKNLKSINKTSSAIKNSKQSILKQIYGHSQEGKVYQTTRPPSKLKLSDMQLVSVNNLQCVNLLENMGKSKQFSYNMRPTTAAKSKNTK